MFPSKQLNPHGGKSAGSTPKPINKGPRPEWGHSQEVRVRFLMDKDVKIVANLAIARVVRFVVVIRFVLILVHICFRTRCILSVI